MLSHAVSSSHYAAYILDRTVSAQYGGISPLSGIDLRVEPKVRGGSVVADSRRIKGDVVFEHVDFAYLTGLMY